MAILTVFDREKRFEGLPGASMQLHFLGTASCIPSTSRGVSCTVLRNEGDLWMFDVGEGTQIQVEPNTVYTHDYDMYRLDISKGRVCTALTGYLFL